MKTLLNSVGVVSLLIGTASLSNATTLSVSNVKFNWDTSSATSDAINIRWNYSLPLDLSHGEWTSSGLNQPAGYATNQSVQIQARLTTDLSGENYVYISAQALNAGSLGDVVGKTVHFVSGVSDPEYVTFDLASAAPGAVSKSICRWQWIASNINGSGSPATNMNISGPHTIYTILEAPVQPWDNSSGNQRNPWISALELACQWAAGTTTMEGAGTQITEAINGSSQLVYQGGGGGILPDVMALGTYHTLAISNGGSLWSWGYNYNYQLGHDFDNDTHVPGKVVDNSGLPVTGVTAVSAGHIHSLALKSDGTVWAWGWDWFGAMGDSPASADQEHPTQIAALDHITSIASGTYHCLALKSDGTAWAWGRADSGQLSGSSVAPHMMAGGSNVVALAGGETHSLVLKTDGTVWACGANSSGQLGDGTTTARSTLVQVPNLNGIVAIAAGSYNSYALRADGVVYAWGAGGCNGNGTNVTQTSPAPVLYLTNIVAISAGRNDGYAVKSEGTVWAWGSNQGGQLGNGGPRILQPTLIPVQVNPTNMPSTTLLAHGGDAYHMFAIASDGTLHSWGHNGYGQLGNGTTGVETNPIPLANFAVALQSHYNYYPYSGLELSKMIERLSGGPGFGQGVVCDELAGTAVSLENLLGGEFYIGSIQCCEECEGTCDPCGFDINPVTLIGMAPWTYSSFMGSWHFGGHAVPVLLQTDGGGINYLLSRVFDPCLQLNGNPGGTPVLLPPVNIVFDDGVSGSTNSYKGLFIPQTTSSGCPYGLVVIEHSARPVIYR